MLDILFILALALLILGPKKLPQIARQLGGLLAQFKQMQNDFKRQLDVDVLKVQMDNTTADARWPIAVSRAGNEHLPALEQPDPWVTNFRSAELNSSPLTNAANIAEPSVAAEQIVQHSTT